MLPSGWVEVLIIVTSGGVVITLLPLPSVVVTRRGVFNVTEA